MTFESTIPEGVTLPTPKTRELFFTKQVNQDSIGDLAKNILDINKNDRYLEKLYNVYGLGYNPAPIKLYIDSYGGSVYQCLGLVSVIKKSRTPIHTIVTGVAMSAGFMIAIHGHWRFSYKYSTLMYHQLSSMVWGKLAEIHESVEEFNRLQRTLEDLVSEATKIPQKILVDNFEHKRDWFMSAEEALINGCIDEIL